MDLSVTPADVQQSGAAKIKTAIAAVAILAGQAILKGASGMVLSDATDAATAGCDGIALNGAAAGQPVSYATEDAEFEPGAAVAAGTIYVVSATAGGIAPEADIATTELVTIVGIGISATQIKLFCTPKLGSVVHV